MNETLETLIMLATCATMLGFSCRYQRLIYALFWLKSEPDIETGVGGNLEMEEATEKAELRFERSEGLPIHTAIVSHW